MDWLSDVVERNWIGIWKGLFIVATLGFLALTILYGFTRSVSLGWFLLLVLLVLLFVSSLITATETWELFLDKVGTLAWETFVGGVKTMVGLNGPTMFLFANGVTLFLLGLLAMSNGNADNGAFISAVGVVMIIGGLISIPAKIIHNKK